MGIRIKTPLGLNQLITRISFMFILLSVALLSGCEEHENEALQEQEATISLKHPIDERYINITQYELFYRSEQMESKEAVTFHALMEAIEVHALLEYLEAQEIRIEPEKRELQRKLLTEQLTHDLQNPDFQHYFDTLKNALQIDEQDYIEQYLLVNKTYEILEREMFSTKVGLQVDDNGDASYPTSENERHYWEQMGISFDYIEYLAESMPEYLLEPKVAPTVLFDNDYMNLTTNREGAVILRGKEFSLSDLTSDQYSFLVNFAIEHQLQELARYNFSTYQELLQTAAREDATKRGLAEQFLAMLTVVETTLDWEFGELFVYDGAMPTFDPKKLRKHQDITQQLIEHQFYYHSKETPKKFYAYRVATEKIVEMYGLFNYLQQDFDVALDAQKIASIRAEQQQNLQQQLEDPYFKRYVDEVLETYQISLDTYLDDYLLVLAEYEALVEVMQQQHIGLDLDGRYNKGEVNARYRNAANLSWQHQFDEMERIGETAVIEPLDPQPDFAFELIRHELKLGLNEAGNYVFTDIVYLQMWFTDAQQTAFDELVATYDLPPLSRYSIGQYIHYLEQVQDKTKSQQQLFELIKIYQDTLAL